MRRNRRRQWCERALDSAIFPNRQAPAFFKRSGVYYAVFGQCCCYCEPGATVHAYTASSPLGPFTDHGPIDSSAAASACPALLGSGRAATLRVSAATASLSGAAAEEEEEAHGCELAATSVSAIRFKQTAGTPIRAQQTDIFRYFDSQGQDAFAWIGDHWQSSPDRVKAHDFTVWSPMVFDGTGNIQTMFLLANFTLDVGVPPWTG
jgi:hypothetical protein